MTIATPTVPRYTVCPPIYTPDFIPGPAPCTLQSFTEVRSRGVVQDLLFFRSADPGSEFNAIDIEVQWWDDVNDIATSIETEVSSVKITVTYGGVVFDEHIPQTYNIGSTMPPPIVLAGWNDILPAQLSTFITNINNNPANVQPTNPTEPLIEVFSYLSGVDVQQPWPPATTPTTLYFLNNTNITLNGGQSGPIGAPIGVRTGPTFSMVVISQSERDQANGAMVSLGQNRVYDGIDWVNIDDLPMKEYELITDISGNSSWELVVPC